MLFNNVSFASLLIYPVHESFRLQAEISFFWVGLRRQRWLVQNTVGAALSYYLFNNEFILFLLRNKTSHVPNNGRLPSLLFRHDTLALLPYFLFISGSYTILFKPKTGSGAKESKLYNASSQKRKPRECSMRERIKSRSGVFKGNEIKIRSKSFALVWIPGCAGNTQRSRSRQFRWIDTHPAAALTFSSPLSFSFSLSRSDSFSLSIFGAD